MSTKLSVEKEFTVRFSEVDALAIVWHGNYLKYFEDGREAFGKKYEFDYLDTFNQGFVTPLVHVEMDYRRPLTYGDKAIVETVFINSEAAKIIFDYTIKRADTGEIVTKGNTVQIFLNSARELVLTSPEFFIEWKKRWGIIQ